MMDPHDAVGHMPLFRGLDPRDLDALAALAEPRAYGAHEYLFDARHPADALYAVLIGTVEITLEGKDLPVVTVGSGQTIGDLAFFARGPYGGSACTREPTRALRIPFDAVDRLLAERPSLALRFHQNAAHEFAHHLRQLAAERDRPYL